MTSIFWIVLSPSDYSYNSRSESADRALAIVNIRADRALAIVSNISVLTAHSAHLDKC